VEDESNIELYILKSAYLGCAPNSK